MLLVHSKPELNRFKSFKIDKLADESLTTRGLIFNNLQDWWGGGGPKPVKAAVASPHGKYITSGTAPDTDESVPLGQRVLPLPGSNQPKDQER